MGADYDAKTYLGVPVSEGEVLRDALRSHQRCRHPEAEGNRFCPKCGLPESGRTILVDSKVFAPRLAAHLPSEWKYVSVASLLQYTDPDGGRAKVQGFQFIRLDPSSEDSDGQLIFGCKVASASHYPWKDAKNPEPVPFSDLAERAIEIEVAARVLGFVETVQLYTLCYVGV
jgi:hypothetical protein